MLIHYEKRKAQNHVLNLGLCEVYVNESIFCDICKNGSNFLFIDFIATPLPWMSYFGANLPDPSGAFTMCWAGLQ